MSKKDKYLNDLNNTLDNYKYKKDIVDKYDSLIEKKLSEGQKITEIIKELGSAKDIRNKEVTTYRVTEKIKNIKNKIKDKSKKVLTSTKKFLRDRSKKIEFKNKLNKFKNKFKFKKNKKKPVKKNRDNILNKTKKVVLAKKVKSKYSLLIFIVQVLLFILLFYVLVIFMASLFAILDGIKFYGLSIFLFGLSLFIYLILSYLDRKKYCIDVNSRFYFISFVLTLIILALGVGYTTYNYFDVDYVSDLSEKYSFVTQTLEYRVSNEKDLHIYFNSWYKNYYLIQIDDRLDDKVKVEIKYYEAFYDLHHKIENGNMYISLSCDSKDIVSLYLNNLKENKIYNEKELSRYLIRIYVSEKNAKKLIIHN